MCALTCATFSSRVALVANRAGVALIDPVTAAYARQRVAVKPFAPAVEDHFYIVTNASQPMPVVADTFWDEVREAFGRLVAEL
ncbi:LysR substrate-binding domain-containing protein [Paraburkholderia dipogonis]